MSLERIFRPFETRVTTPPRFVPKSEEGTADNALLVVSGSGDAQIYHLSYSHSVTKYMTKQSREDDGS